MGKGHPGKVEKSDFQLQFSSRWKRRTRRKQQRSLFVAADGSMARWDDLYRILDRAGAPWSPPPLSSTLLRSKGGCGPGAPRRRGSRGTPFRVKDGGCGGSMLLFSSALVRILGSPRKFRPGCPSPSPGAFRHPPAFAPPPSIPPCFPCLVCPAAHLGVKVSPPRFCDASLCLLLAAFGAACASPSLPAPTPSRSSHVSTIEGRPRHPTLDS